MPERLRAPISFSCIALNVRKLRQLRQPTELSFVEFRETSDAANSTLDIATQCLFYLIRKWDTFVIINISNSTDNESNSCSCWKSKCKFIFNFYLTFSTYERKIHLFNAFNRIFYTRNWICFNFNITFLVNVSASKMFTSHNSVCSNIPNINAKKYCIRYIYKFISAFEGAFATKEGNGHKERAYKRTTIPLI